MKVKLKEGEKLSSMNNYCGLNMDDWTALNQEKSVELDSIPELLMGSVDLATERKKIL